MGTPCAAVEIDRSRCVVSQKVQLELHTRLSRRQRTRVAMSASLTGVHLLRKVGLETIYEIITCKGQRICELEINQSG